MPKGSQVVRSGGDTALALRRMRCADARTVPLGNIQNYGGKVNRRSFLKRLGLIPAALVGAKLVEHLPAKAVPVPEVPLTPLVPYVPYVPHIPWYDGPVWISPYGGSAGNWGGCPACINPTITSAAHTHGMWSSYTVNSNTANFSGYTLVNIA